MKKFKDLKKNEKLLIIMAVLLIVALTFNIPKVKEGFLRGCEKLGITIFSNNE